MLVIGRVVRRQRQGKSRMMAAVPARRERLTLHHRHLMLVLMDTVMDDVVDSGFWAEIARFELFHKFYARAGDCPSAGWAMRASSATFRRGGVASSNSSDPTKHSPAME